MIAIVARRTGRKRMVAVVPKIPKRKWRIARNMQAAGWPRHAIANALGVDRAVLDARLDSQVKI